MQLYRLSYQASFSMFLQYVGAESKYFDSKEEWQSYGNAKKPTRRYNIDFLIYDY
jgi:hypothetical protein